MVLRLSYLLGAAFAAITILAPATRAQSDAGQITRHAVQAMQQVTANTIDDVQAAGATGVAVIERLDANGATDEQLIQAAHRAVQGVHRRAAQGDRRVSFIAANAIEQLRQLGADRHFFETVRDARATSHDAIGRASERAVNAIQIALREALGG